MRSVAEVSPAEIARSERRNFVRKRILLTRNSHLWSIGLDTWAKDTSLARRRKMDFPPIVNLALWCQIEVKGEGSCCRMTHIVSWWNGSRKTSLNHRRSATDRAAYCRGGGHLRVWRQSCSSALVNRA